MPEPAKILSASLRRCHGLALVEFVIILPICLMLIMATAEFGRAFLQYNTLSKAVRDGSRYVAGKALFGSTGTVSVTPSLATQTKNLVVYGNVLGVGTPLLPDLAVADVAVANAGGGNVSVTANYPYTPIFAFVPRFSFGGNINVSGYTLQTSVTIRAL